PRRLVTPSEGDRKSRRRVSVRLWFRVTSAPSPLPVSPLRIPSLFPFSDCKVGLFNLFLGPVGKDEKQSRRRGSKERRKVLPADCLQSGHTLVGVGARMNLSLSITRDLVHQEEGVLELHSSCVGHGDVSGRSGDVGSVCKEKEVVQTAGPWRGDFLHKWRNRRMNTDGGSDGKDTMQISPRVRLRCCPRLQETAPWRRGTIPQHTWPRDGLASNPPDQATGVIGGKPALKGPWDLTAQARGERDLPRVPWHGLFCVEGEACCPTATGCLQESQASWSRLSIGPSPDPPRASCGLCFLRLVCSLCSPVGGYQADGHELVPVQLPALLTETLES
ncbi:hypothetical protein E2I00_001886, partial [Balaenoptera physalus]